MMAERSALQELKGFLQQISWIMNHEQFGETWDTRNLCWGLIQNLLQEYLTIVLEDFEGNEYSRQVAILLEQAVDHVEGEIVNSRHVECFQNTLGFIDNPETKEEDVAWLIRCWERQGVRSFRLT